MRAMYQNRHSNYFLWTNCSKLSQFATEMGYHVTLWVIVAMTYFSNAVQNISREKSPLMEYSNSISESAYDLTYGNQTEVGREILTSNEEDQDSGTPPRSHS